MSDDHSGFIMDIKRPTRDGQYVACLVITPMSKNRKADVDAKVERNMGRGQCIRLVNELLKHLDAPNELLSQVEAFSNGMK